MKANLWLLRVNLQLNFFFVCFILLPQVSSRDCIPWPHSRFTDSSALCCTCPDSVGVQEVLQFSLEKISILFAVDDWLHDRDVKGFSRYNISKSPLPAVVTDVIMLFNNNTVLAWNHLTLFFLKSPGQQLDRECFHLTLSLSTILKPAWHDKKAQSKKIV